jgi:hypothetical protein
VASLSAPPPSPQSLRCCGVLEVARIARAGFPTRYTHLQFAERYAILLPGQEQAALLEGRSEGARKACTQLLHKFQLGQDHYQVRTVPNDNGRSGSGSRLRPEVVRNFSLSFSLALVDGAHESVLPVRGARVRRGQMGTHADLGAPDSGVE